MEAFARQPRASGVDLLLFPECFLQGYLVESEHLSRYALDLTTTSFQKILDRLSPIRPTLVFGVIEQCGAAYFNTAVVVRHGVLEGFYRKTHLVPGERLFQAGDAYPTFNLNGVTCGINICYDTNFPETAKAVAEQGARVLLVPSQNMMKLQAEVRRGSAATMRSGPNVLGKPACGWCQPTSRAHGTEAGLATGRPAS